MSLFANVMFITYLGTVVTEVIDPHYLYRYHKRDLLPALIQCQTR